MILIGSLLGFGSSWTHDPKRNHAEADFGSSELCRPSAEIELLLCCARTRTNPEMLQRLREAARKEIDWFQFVRLALRHDTLSLTYRNLDRICGDIVPSGVLEPLRARHEADATETPATCEGINRHSLFP